MLLDVRLGPLNRGRDSADNYRALKVNWTGTPSWSPKIAAGPAKAVTQILPSKLRVAHNSTTLNDTAYFSWNGATEVAKWVILASNDTAAALNTTSAIWAEVSKTGFECNITVGVKARYVRALAVNTNGRTLGATPVLDMKTGSTTDEIFDLQAYNVAEGSVFGSTWRILAAHVQRIREQADWKIAAGVAGGIFGLSVLVLGVWLYYRHQRSSETWNQQIAGGYSHVNLVEDAFGVSNKLESGVDITEIGDDDDLETSELLEYNEKDDHQVAIGK